MSFVSQVVVVLKVVVSIEWHLSLMKCLDPENVGCLGANGMMSYLYSLTCLIKEHIGALLPFPANHSVYCVSEYIDV